MTFLEAVRGHADKSLTSDQVDELYVGLKKLEEFFNKNYAEGDNFASSFYDKFQTLVTQFGFTDGQEGLLDSLYELEEFEALAANVIITIRKVAYDYDFCEYTYEKMMMEMRGEDE